MSTPQTRAMDLANAIPGVTCSRFALEGNTVLSGRVVGRGPSLHPTGMAWAVTMDLDDERLGLGELLDLQLRRLEAARALGLGDERIEPGQVSHIDVDATLRRFEVDLRVIVERAAARMVPLSRSGTASTQRDGDLTIGDPIVGHRPQAVHASATDWGEFDGEQLKVYGRTLPESTLAALRGRPVSDVFDPGRTESVLEPLGARRIQRARVAGTSERPMLLIDTRAKWTPLA